MLVEQQLEDEANGNPPLPFQTFLRALREVMRLRPELEQKALLDVGCGVGHYGVLCARHYPQLHYTGSDASYAMVDMASAFHGHYGIRSVFCLGAFEDNPFELFEIVLISQVMEYTADTMAALELALQRMRAGNILILHRLRWDKQAQHVYEKTYCDYDSQNYIWNGAEVTRLVLEYGKLLNIELWESNATLIVEKE